jgi:PKD repeat protein
MKKYLLLFFALIVSSGLFAQTVTRNMVLIEIGTGTGCQYCPGAAMALDDLYANEDPVAGIEYHSYNGSDPFNTPEAAQRTSWYGISGYPTAQFDGEYDEYVGGSNTQSLYGAYLPIVNARMAIPTEFSIELYGTNTGDLYNIVVRSKQLAAYSGTNLKIRFALTESNIPYNWQGQTEINYTERLMAPDANGVVVTYPNIGVEVETNLSFTYNNSWIKDNVELIAWLQDDGNKYVLNTASVMINDLEAPEPTFVADFYGEPENLCGPGTVHFHENCIGDPTEYHWTFDGGYPEESWDANPNVYYSELGEYDVQLIISNGTEKDTMNKAQYIGVHDIPVVTFNAVPELCNEDWDPYEFTEGSPSGGEYEGDFITEGVYFHPTEAGVGEYDITYVYTDEFGCANSDIQTVSVVNCTGLVENTENFALEVYPNPTLGKFTVNINSDLFNTANLKVVDALGKTVFEQKSLDLNKSNSSGIDLTSYPQGVYFVVVSNNDKQLVQKIFLQK